MAKRRVVAMVDPDPEWVSLVDKGAARKTFRVLKRADGGPAQLITEDAEDNDGLTEALKAGNIDNLAKEYATEAHPFTACMNDPMLVKQYPDAAQRKQICGAVKARIGKTDDVDDASGDGDVTLRKSMIAALKQRLGVLRQLFDKVEERAVGNEGAGEEEQGAAIIGAVFDRQHFSDEAAVKQWMTEQELQWTEIISTDTSYRAACMDEFDDEIEIETQPFETGVVLLVQKAEVLDVKPDIGYQTPNMGYTTSPDLSDQHVHSIVQLQAQQDGWTGGAGNPVHVHRIIGGIVQDWKSSDVVLGGGYCSAHPGSVLSVAAYGEKKIAKQQTPATERANGGQRMKGQGNAASDGSPGADRQINKGLGEGPASHVNFRAGITDVETSPGIFQAFDLMQRVLFNTLNDPKISEKSKHIADNLTEFNNFVLEQIGKFEPGEVVAVEQKRFKTAFKATDPPPVVQATTELVAVPDPLMSELVVLLREALGKPAAAEDAGDDNTDADNDNADNNEPILPGNVQKIADVVLAGITEKFGDIGARLTVVEKTAIGRRGVSEVTETPETRMAQKAGKTSFDNLFPWGRPAADNGEY